MKNNSLSFLILIIAIAFSSCKSPIDKLGPDLCPSSNFTFKSTELKVIGLDVDNKVDLSAGGLHIKANFSESVKWNLKVVAENGSAMKSFSGEGDSVDVWWFGNVDALPLFTIGDARVELDIACTALVEQKFKITVAPNFKNLNSTYGVLLRDFDKNGIAPVLADTFTSGTDGWAGVNGDIDKHYQYFSTEPSFAGGNYAEFHSKSTAVTWYHGGTSWPVSSFAGRLSTSNPDSVYLNFYCRGYGLENTGLEVALSSTGGNYFHTEPITWVGWKLISIKLSDLKISTGPNAGNKLTDVDGISQCLVQLGSNPEKTNEARSAYDFFILTVGEPFVKE